MPYTTSGQERDRVYFSEPKPKCHSSYSVLSLNEIVGKYTHFTVNKTFYFTWANQVQVQLNDNSIEGLHEITEYIDIFLFPHITQSCSVSDVLFTGGRGVSDFSVLKYY